MKKPDRAFLHDNAAAMTVQVLSIGISLGSFYLVARRLGPDQYGMYVGIYALLFPLSGIVYQGNSRSFVQMRRQAALDEPVAFRRFLDIGVPLIVAGCLAAVGIGVAIFGWVALVPMVLIAANELLLSAVTDVVVAIDICRNGYASSFYYQLMSLTARFSTVVLLIVLPIDHINEVTIASFVCLVTTIVLFLWRRPLVGLRVAESQHKRATDLRSASLLGLDLFAIGVQTDADKVVLAGGSHSGVSGIYAVAYKLVQLSLMPVNSLVEATHYRLVSSAHEGRRNTLRVTLRLSALALAYAAIAFPIMWIALGEVWRVLGDDYRMATDIGRSLLFVLVLRAPAILPLNALLAYGMVGVRTVISMSCAGVALVLYVSLIPAFSWHGAVIGTLASEILLLIAAWTTLVRASRLPEPDADVLAEANG